MDSARKDPGKKRPSKTLYLDSPSQNALDFLKQQVPKGGLRFSNSVLFREMLEQLRDRPEAMLDIERHPKRGQDKGKFICIPLAAEDMVVIEELDSYYQKNAAVRHRARDRVPKSQRLPISQLYASFVRARASALGWSDE
ncbi:hypothetical protein dsx2_1798 [Desulfovibrio sp. X2]|uniref:hypothetical protein n=1 Tax=Desulfovibrio sp. X2 TaxID=941449 RepID=UPI000358A5EB|nr:hypothetical protein [Desulfovibrio sp. X2]EPR44203.1 hypothetical protein dsx2_1798 [Desulfovibrio sp. X2]